MYVCVVAMFVSMLGVAVGGQGPHCHVMTLTSPDHHYHTNESPYQEVTSMEVSQLHTGGQWGSRCPQGDFGFYGRTIWVQNGCSAEFKVCGTGVFTPAAENLSLSVNHDVIIPGTTRSLLVNCSLPVSTHTQSFDTNVWQHNLTISYRNNSQSDFVALVNMRGSAAYAESIPNSPNYQYLGNWGGKIRLDSTSYLNSQWFWPSSSVAGWYRCEAKGHDPSGNPVTLFSPDVEVTSVSPTERPGLTFTMTPASPATLTPGSNVTLICLLPNSVREREMPVVNDVIMYHKSRPYRDWKPFSLQSSSDAQPDLIHHYQDLWNVTLVGSVSSSSLSYLEVDLSDVNLSRQWWYSFDFKCKASGLDRNGSHVILTSTAEVHFQDS